MGMRSEWKRRWLQLVLLIVGLPGSWLLLGCGDESAPTPRDPSTVRVVCWNLEWFPGGSPRASDAEKASQMQLAREAFAEFQPDLVLTQEIRAGNHLAEALEGVEGAGIATASRFSGAQQLGIASRLPCEAAWTERWKQDGFDDPPRGFAHAALRLPSGRLLLAYTVHLKSNAGGDPVSNRKKREDAARQLLAHIASELPKHRKQEEQEPAVLIAGDFNTDPAADQFAGEKTLTMIEEAGFEWALKGLDPGDRITWPSDGRYPDATFDHVFVKGLKVVKIQIPDDYDRASDHRPVIVDITDLDAPKQTGGVSK